jgi:DNA processing protein
MNDLGGSARACAFQRLFFAHPSIAKSLLQTRGNLEGVFAGDRSELQPIFGRHHALYRKFIEFNSWDLVERDLAQLSTIGGTIFSSAENSYPQALASIYDPPPVLQVVGDIGEIFRMPAIGIVGSRKASAHAKEMAYELACDLSALGAVIVSGLAYGVDAAAHRGAIAGSGRTIAVIGAGLDNDYPSGHRQLRESIQEKGLVVSEFPLGTEPYPANFPQRNRVIGGLCTAVIVVEAAKRSGSLITARFALEQGREVLALPGVAGSPLCKGSNALIRDGAALVESAEDVVDILSDQLSTAIYADHAEKRLGHLENDVGKDSPLLNAVPTGKSVSVDDIIAITGLRADLVLRDLTSMMISGLIEELPGRYFRKVRKGE